MEYLELFHDNHTSSNLARKDSLEKTSPIKAKISDIELVFSGGLYVPLELLNAPNTPLVT